MTKWISIKDRLPDKKGKYLTFHISKFGKPTMRVSRASNWRFGSKVVFVVGNSREWDQRITHWMPLPDEPS